MAQAGQVSINHLNESQIKASAAIFNKKFKALSASTSLQDKIDVQKEAIKLNAKTFI